MQRNQNESFDAYKARRAAANIAVKQINAQSKGGTIGSREQLRNTLRNAGKGKLRGTYGDTLRNHFDSLPAKLRGH